jgi:Peptidase family S41
MKRVLLLVLCWHLFAVSFSQSPHNPLRKLPADALRADLVKLRRVMESSHPGLYWYTPKDSMDLFFDRTQKAITDSMTILQFRSQLSQLLSKIHCGHTTVRLSRRQSAQLRRLQLRSFPLLIKVWPGDTMVVLANANRKDSFLNRGTFITSIGGKTTKELVDTLFSYASMDGYSINHKYQSLSNNFPFYYGQIAGKDTVTPVRYIDTAGNERSATVNWYNPRADSLAHRITRLQRVSKKEQRRRQLAAVRNIRIDTASSVAVLTLNSFSEGKLKKFFRQSFRQLKADGIRHLIIDLRNNGGGSVKNYIDLTSYIRSSKWKVADTIAAVRRNFGWNFFSNLSFPYWLGMNLFTKKRADGLFHFGYWERHYFKPHRRNHFNGKVYVITGGNTFSAATLFAAAVKGQPGVTLVGEETGGALYGNNGMMIPDITLPHSQLRVRLPLFKLVMDKNKPDDGRGIIPDVVLYPSAEALRKGIDRKMEAIKKMIETNE